MHIFRYMDPRLVVSLKSESRDEALRQLVEEIHAAGKLSDLEEFFQAIMEREKIVSTGVGMGVAIPHAKLPSYDQFFIAIGILQKPLDWDSLDRAPVRLIFMIGGPDDKQTEYLKILSSLTQVIKDDDKRKKILTLKDPKAMVELFKGI